MKAIKRRNLQLTNIIFMLRLIHALLFINKHESNFRASDLAYEILTYKIFRHSEISDNNLHYNFVTESRFVENRINWR